MKKIVFTFGRYNPPTVGHAELITYAVKLAQRTGADHRIYTSNSHDASKNPLSPRQKVSFLRQIFPGVNFIADANMKTAFAICKKLTEEGYEDVTFVVGDDRVAEFSRSLSKYVKPKTAKDFNPKIHYPFKNFKVVSSGARKKGISGTDLRAAVKKGDFATFAKASAARDKTLARKIFAATRAQLNEEIISENKQYAIATRAKTKSGWRRVPDTRFDTEDSAKRYGDKYHTDRSGSRMYRVIEHPDNKKRNLREEMSRKDFSAHLDSFIDFCCDKLSISNKPSLKFKEPTDQGEQPSFAAYAPGAREVHVMSKNRHPMDIFRSVAHELVHHKQNEDGRIGKDIAKEGATGSDIENEANSRAGELMRWYGKANPAAFSLSYVTENKAIIMAGVPGSGKDKILKETILPFGFTEISSETYTTPSDRLVVVNGIANFERIRFIKEDLESAGYQTIMVFVNTSNEVSRQRNEARADKGGRVINEAVRYTKWKNAQDTLDRYDDLFERVIVVQNDLDLNQSQEIIQETHHKLVEMVSEDIRLFSLAPVDKRFENMLEGYTDFSINNRQNPTGGAGNWGTSKLADKYKSDTPGQVPGKNLEMGYFKYAKTKAPKTKVFGNLPKFGDRINQTHTSAKNPSFVGDITGDHNTFMPSEPMAQWSAVDRWMMKEETRKRFKAKYGYLAEQKIKETAAKLRKEGMWDASSSSGFTGATPNSGNAESERPDINAEFEKMAIMKPKGKLNNKTNPEINQKGTKNV